MATRTVIDLSQTPIIKSLVERSADDRVRLAGVESVQALIINEVITKLDLILARLGIAVPDLANTLIVSTLLITTVEGAPAAFATLQSTADDQDDRLSQLEAA